MSSENNNQRKQKEKKKKEKKREEVEEVEEERFLDLDEAAPSKGRTPSGGGIPKNGLFYSFDIRAPRKKKGEPVVESIVDLFAGQTVEIILRKQKGTVPQTESMMGMLIDQLFASPLVPLVTGSAGDNTVLRLRCSALLYMYRTHWQKTWQDDIFSGDTKVFTKRRRQLQESGEKVKFTTTDPLQVSYSPHAKHVRDLILYYLSNLIISDGHDNSKKLLPLIIYYYSNPFHIQNENPFVLALCRFFAENEQQQKGTDGASLLVSLFQKHIQPQQHTDFGPLIKRIRPLCISKMTNMKKKVAAIPTPRRRRDTPRSPKPTNEFDAKTSTLSFLTSKDITSEDTQALSDVDLSARNRDQIIEVNGNSFYTSPAVSVTS